MQTFGQSIRELRTQRGMTLQALAVRTGISVAYLSNIEWRRRCPADPDKIKVIARVLGANFSQLMKLAERDLLESRLRRCLHSLTKQQQEAILLLVNKSSDQVIWQRLFDAVRDIE